MKELDCKKICAEIEAQLDETDYDLEALIGRSLAVMTVLNVYLVSDILKAHGQNLDELGVSVITTRYRCSVIIGEEMSWYKLSVPICDYLNLADDIESILNVIQVAIDRIDC